MSTGTKICKKCQTEIPKKAKVCPQCRSKQGAPIIPIAIGVVVLLVAISSFSNGDNKNEVSKQPATPPVKEIESANQPTTPVNDVDASDNSTSQEVEQSKDLEFGLNEVAVFPDLEITALEISKSDGTDFIKPEEGKTFVGVKFEIKNTSSEASTISSLLLFDTYIDDVKADISFSAMTAFSDGTLDGELESGKKMIGWIAVEADANAKNIELVVKDNWLSNNKAKFIMDIQ